MHKKLLLADIINGFLFSISVPMIHSEMMRSAGTKDMVALSSLVGHCITLLVAHLWLKNHKKYIQWTPFLLLIDVSYDILTMIVAVFTGNYFWLFFLSFTIGNLTSMNLHNVLIEFKDSKCLGTSRKDFDRVQSKWMSIVCITSSSLSLVLNFSVFFAYLLRIVGSVVNTVLFFSAYKEYKESQEFQDFKRSN